MVTSGNRPPDSDPVSIEDNLFSHIAMCHPSLELVASKRSPLQRQVQVRRLREGVKEVNAGSSIIAASSNFMT